MFFGLDDSLLQGLGILNPTPLAWLASQLLLLQLSLLVVLFAYVFWRRIKRAFQRRNNRERASAFRDTILDYVRAQKEDKLPERRLLDRAVRSATDYGFLRRILLAQIEVSSERDRRILQNLYEDLGYFTDDLKRTRSLFWWRRLAAVARLEKSRITAASASLLKLFDDQNELVAISAIRGLARMDYPDKENLILDTLARVAPGRSDLFLDLLLRFGQKQPQVVTQFLENCYDPNLAQIAIDVIGRLEIQEATERVVSFLGSGDDNVVAQSIRTLRNLNRVDAIPSLDVLAENASALIRAEAALCLRKTHPDRAKKMIRLLRSDASLQVKRVLFEAEVGGRA